MNIQNVITVGIMAVATSAMAFDYCEVTGVNARQRYPWNGLVDIDFTLDSKATEPYLMNVTVFDNVGKTNLPVKTVYTEGISFEENPCMVHKDTSRIIWNAAADLPDGLKCTNVLVTCQDVRSMGISNLYMIVDLSDGTSAASFPVTYTNCPPTGGWTEEYMTTKLVLRRVEPGSFLMGSPFAETDHQSNETQHKVTLTRPYYIGVFELTAKQSALICGGTGSDTKPVEKTWNEIRGSDMVSAVTTTTNNAFVSPYQITFTINQQKTASSYMWPTSSDVAPESLMGKLRSKTSLQFDLPTEAQWEYACRAGSALPINIGGENTTENVSAISGVAKLDPSESHYIYVGCYMPNALGIYDMSGNVGEWCLDVYTANLGTSESINPTGGNVAYESVSVMSNVYVCGGEGAWSEKFEGITFTCPSSWSISCYATYNAWGIKRVVRGLSPRSASRQASAVNLNTSGTIFSTGLTGKATKKASYSNPTYGVRVAVTVD